MVDNLPFHQMKRHFATYMQSPYLTPEVIEESDTCEWASKSESSWHIRFDHVFSTFMHHIYYLSVYGTLISLMDNLLLNILYLESKILAIGIVCIGLPCAHGH